VDIPSHRGYDPDARESEGEVGRNGVNICCYRDFEEMFNGIDISQVSLSLVAGSAAPWLMAMYYILAEKRGLDLSRLEGSIQNDVLKDHEVIGCSCAFPPRPSLKLAIDVSEFLIKNLPRWNFVNFNAHAIRENGVTAIQELSYVMSNARTYARSLIERGYNVDQFAPRFSFMLAADNNFFEEIAKYRAVRRIFARMMKEEFGVQEPRSMTFRVAVQTAGRTLTAQQPYVNLVRAGFQSLAAVIGGCQSLNTDALDEALGIPTEEANELALRTQQVIAYETGVTDTIDPLAGSYYVEWLTNEIEKRVCEHMEKIEQAGGVLTALENGFFDKEVFELQYRWFKEIQNGKRVMIGVNKYVKDEVPTYSSLKISPEYEETQKAKVAKLRQERDATRVSQAIDGLRKAIKQDVNLMPSIIETVKADATAGEIAGVLRKFYGSYVPHARR